MRQLGALSARATGRSEPVEVRLKQVIRSALVPYSSAQMYALVNEVERYPEFLPWCRGATVLDRGDESVTARLTLSRGGVAGSFTTRNELEPHQRVSMRLVDGPFKTLEGTWTFKSIGDAGCRVELDVRFEMKNALTGLLLGKAFEESCNRLVESFTARAREVYGGA